MFILALTVFESSVNRIVFEEFELLDFPTVPVKGDMNLACMIAGFLCPSFWTTSLDILKCGSWSTASGIRQYSDFLFRTFGKNTGTVCIAV